MKAENIAEEILKQRKGEEDNNALQLAVARADAKVEGMNQTVFWLYNSEYDSVVGNYKQQRYNRDQKTNHCIAKNTPLGGQIIKRQSGSFSTPKGIFELKFKSLATYQPIRKPKIDATNGTIEIKGKAKVQFRSIYELVEFLETTTVEIKIDVEQLLADQQQALELGKQLSAAEEQQLKELYEITRYIRENNEMRMKAILDPQQEEIKRSRIFYGTLVIDGGPGTGKTTTLIQRIKFLIDDTIVEYGDHYKRLLPELKGKKGWIFFSPSSLLLGYLRNAMVSEGLAATDQSSKVWGNFINNELMKNYGFVGTDRPFKLYSGSDKQILPNNPLIIRKALDAFQQFILKQIKDRIQRSAEVEILVEEGKLFRQRIKNDILGIRQASDLVRLIVNADEVEKNYKSDFEKIAKEIRSLLQREADTVLVRLKRDKEVYNKVGTHLKELFDKRQPALADDDDDDLEVEEQKTNIFNEDIEIRNGVRNWVRALALNNASSAESIPEKQKDWIEIIKKYVSDLSLDELGKKLHFLKYTSPLVQGSSALFFAKLTSLYKKFRKSLPDFLISNNLHSASIIMKDVLKSDIAKLHYDERNYILLFVNEIIRELQKINAQAFNSNVHSYIEVYKEQQRFVIGIDEASDFSLIELACMHSFSHPSYNCTTLSGDLMQRMTNSGLTNWDNFLELVGDGELRHLSISYRQSSTLLELAKRFYEVVTEKKASYTSYSLPSPYEPKPVVKKFSDFEEKIEWITQKLLRINNTYDNKIPSTAIFVPDDEAVMKVTKRLKQVEDLAENGIDIRGVTKDGVTIDKSQVNVYNIEAIKGLEFEAVFFIDVDGINEADDQLLQKYIYVGISRAAYYLFVTYKNTLPSGLDILKEYEE